jgi:hypothetical protein
MTETLTLRIGGENSDSSPDGVDEHARAWLAEGGSTLSYIQIDPRTGDVQIKSPGGMKVVITQARRGVVVTLC